MRVLALGLSRSGTDSLRQALLQLGYDHTYHGFDAPVTPGETELWHRLALKKYSAPDGDADISADDFDQILAHCEAVTDSPAAIFAAELIKAYPDAKVILNTRRDLEKWYESHLTAFGPIHGILAMYVRSWFCAESYWLWKCFEMPFYHFYYDDFKATAKWRYREHVAMTKGIMQGQEGRMLEWSVEDGWGPLCDFLGKEVPKKDFPSGNAPKEFLERVGKIRRDLDRSADRNMLVFGAGVVVLVAGLVQGVRYLSSG